MIYLDWENVSLNRQSLNYMDEFKCNPDSGHTKFFKYNPVVCDDYWIKLPGQDYYILTLTIKKNQDLKTTF